MAQFASDGTAYELFGPVDAPAVALVHGLGLTRAIWDDYVPALAQRYRVLNYDLGGHGESAVPTDKPDLTSIALQLKELMDETGIDKAAVLGFSIGGMINRRFAMDFPERVTALGILNSPHERGDEAQRLVEARAADTSSGGPGANLDETLARWFTPDFLAQRTDYTDWVRRTLLANDPDNYANFRMVLASGVVELIRPNPPITTPSLVITCENDSGSNPKMSHDIAAEIAGAKTIIVPTLQHMGMVEQPELFVSPLLDFLGATLSPQDT